MQTLLAKFPLVLTDVEMHAIGVTYGWEEEFLKPPPLHFAKAPASRNIASMLKSAPPTPPPQLSQLTPLAAPPAEVAGSAVAGSRVSLPAPPPPRAASTVADAQAAVRPKAKASVSPPQNAVPVNLPQNAVPVSPPQNAVANASSSSQNGSAGNENGLEERLCAICQQPLEDGNPVYVTPCAHVFHQECTQRWQACNRTTRALKCPICRHETGLMGTAQGAGAGDQPEAPDASFFEDDDDFPAPSPAPEEIVAAPVEGGNAASEPSFL